jgi:predicted hydrocarbon binding protein
VIITNKTEHDPIADVPVSDAVMRWVLEALEELAGKQSLAGVLPKAGLPELVDNFPVERTSVKGTYTFEKFSNLNMEIFNALSRPAPTILARAGRATYARGLDQYGPLLGAAITAMKILPEGTRLKTGLEGMKFVWDKMYKDANLPTLDHKVEDCGDHFKYSIGKCMVCAGKTSDAPMCHMGAGLLAEGIQWLTGKEYEVREVECRAMGAQACVYVIPKA